MCPDRPTTRDLAFDLMTKLSRGNPGAAVVLYQIFLHDPEPYERLRDIEGLGWSGARIWQLYRDDCGEDIDAFVRLVKDKNFG
jgi:hypothetical protein